MRTLLKAVWLPLFLGSLVPAAAGTEEGAACLYEQRLDLSAPVSGGLSSVPMEALLFENFTFAGDFVGALEWAGAGVSLADGQAGPCSLGATKFQVRFYEDNDGTPAGIIHDEIVAPIVTPLDAFAPIGGTQAPLYRFSAALDNKFAVPVGWVSIARLDEGPCEFFWLESADGDNRAYRAEISVLNVTEENYVVCIAAAATDLPVDTLTVKARLLLERFSDADKNNSSTLGAAEAQLSGVGLFRAEFDALDLNGDQQLRVGELLTRTGRGILHRADSNGNRQIDMQELLRAIQIFNANGYGCADSPGDTEDGYDLQFRGGRGADLRCLPHDSDYRDGPDGLISLSELLRLLQFYSAGAILDCPLTAEDGFCPAFPSSAAGD